MIYWLAYLLMKVTDKIYLNCKFLGKENLPNKGSYIIASNHISNLDPFILGVSCLRKFSYVAKDSLFKNKFLAFLFTQMGAFPIKRDTADFRSIRESLKRLKNGSPLIFFPEGTRGASERIKRLHPGVGFIALKSGVPVIPAFIEGSDQALPPGAKWFRRHRVKIYLGKPLHFMKKQTPEEIVKQIMEHVISLPNLPRPSE